MLYREVLVWETFKHPYLLPFMGVEYGAFPAHPPCIVTPWMKNGTILNYIDRSNSSMQNTHRLVGSHIILANPSPWHLLTHAVKHRAWKSRKALIIFMQATSYMVTFAV